MMTRAAKAGSWWTRPAVLGGNLLPRLKVLSVIGTRPEAINMAPILEALERRDGVVGRLVVSAQHRELADDVLALFGLRADHDLDLMTGNQTPSQVAAAVIARLEPAASRT